MVSVCVCVGDQKHKKWIEKSRQFTSNLYGQLHNVYEYLPHETWYPYTLFQKSSLSKTIHTDATVHTPFTIILFLKLVWAVKSQRHSFFSVSPHWFKFLHHLHSNLAIPMPIHLELVPVPWHLVFFHSLITIPSFLYFLIYNVFFCVCFFVFCRALKFPSLDIGFPSGKP